MQDHHLMRAWIHQQSRQQDEVGQKHSILFPSFYEGFGLPILEAQASGCPVITSDVSSMPEVAGQGAILIRPEIEQICRAMYKIIDDADFKKD